jgi:hypothetical protein
MKKLYNLGASHSVGFNSDTSYSKIIAHTKGYEFVNHAMAGASLSYIIMKLLLIRDQIKSDDIVIVQIPSNMSASMHDDPRNNNKDMLQYSNMTSLNKEIECDFIYGLKYFKTIVETKNYQALHYLIYLHSMQSIVSNLPGKKFMFIDSWPNMDQVDLPYAVKLQSIENTLIDPMTFKEFANNINSNDKYAMHKNGDIDSGHYNINVHGPWADYIWSKL